MTAQDLLVWLQAWSGVPPRANSVDRVVAGSPLAKIRGIAVVWMPTWKALRTARARGLNVVVAHEPTFYSHHDLDGWEENYAKLPENARQVFESAREAKLRWIEKEHMVVLRFHDALDAMAGGMVDCFACALGFEAQPTRAPDRYRVLKLDKPVQARTLARRLARTFAQVNQPGLAFYGDPQRHVGTIGIGTGYSCEPWQFVERGAELGVTIDDRIKTWVEPVWADDTGYPLVIVHHGATEEWGVRHLAKAIRQAFPKLPVSHLPQGNTARWIRSH